MYIRKITIITICVLQALCINAKQPDAILLNQQTNISLSGRKLVRDVSNEILVNNRDGEQYTSVSLNYSKLDKLSKVEAGIYTTDGQLIRKLSKSEIRTESLESEYSFFEDLMVMKFSMKNNTYPYIFKYSYRKSSSQFLSIENWTPELDNDIPTLKATLTVNVPLGDSINIYSRNISPCKIDTIKNNAVYSWKTSFKTIPESEILSPAITNYIPQVQITPRNFKYQTSGSFDSWQSYGQWEFNTNQKLTTLPDFEKAEIRNAIQGMTDTIDIIKKLYHRMQDQTRYVDISIKTGGMIPAPASEVAIDKYGDCKGLSNYFRSVLKFVGIHSIYTDVDAGDKINQINTQIPSQQFNHVILCIPLKKDTLWLDCTSKGPFGYFGTFTQGRHVFLVENRHSHIARIPALKPSDVIDTKKIDIKCDSTGTSTLNYSNYYKGDDFDGLLQISKISSESDQKQIIQQNFAGSRQEINAYKITNFNRDSDFIRLDYKATTNNIYQNYGNETLIRTITFDLPEFEKPSDRKYPVQIDYPLCESDTQTYHLNQGYYVKNQIHNDTISSTYGKYMRSIHKDDGKVVIVKSLVIYAGFITLDDYSDFYNFIKQIKDLENNLILVTTHI